MNGKNSAYISCWCVRLLCFVPLSLYSEDEWISIASGSDSAFLIRILSRAMQRTRCMSEKNPQRRKECRETWWWVPSWLAAMRRRHQILNHRSFLVYSLAAFLFSSQFSGCFSLSYRHRENALVLNNAVFDEQTFLSEIKLPVREKFYHSTCDREKDLPGR